MSEDERPTAPARPASLDTGAWDIVAYLLSGLLVWGGAGWLLDRWLGTQFLVAVGILLGAGLSTYAVFRRYGSAPAPAAPADGSPGENDGPSR